MNPEEMLTLVKEIQKLLEPRNNSVMLENYIKIRPVIVNPIEGLPDISPVINEICICILMQLYQAAITLTNNLVEKYLKMALIYHEGDYNKQGENIIEKSKNIFTESRKKYDGMILRDTIEEAFKKGIIDETDRADLQTIRDDYRNAYGHATQRKIFKDVQAPLQGATFNDSTGINFQETEKADIADIPFIQGICQVEHAKATAIPYFLHMMSIIRRSQPNIFRKADKT